jgi:membrane associated rhomboid family serine protease
VAWQAHIGGFLAGLVLFALFDPVPRATPDAADASSTDASNRG